MRKATLANCGSTGNVPGRNALFLAIMLICCSGLLVALSGIWIYSIHGSVHRFLAKQRGELIAVCPSSELEVTTRFTQRADRTFRVVNLAEVPINIVGANVTCGCLEIEGLPISLEPFAEGELTARITPTASGVGTPIRQSATLLLDVDGPRPRLTLTARFADQ